MTKLTMNPYYILQVPVDATQEDIKIAYRRASSEAHPDKGGSHEEQVALNKAYAILGDPATRAKYDAGEYKEDPEELGPVDTMLLQAFATILRTGATGNVLVRVRNWFEEQSRLLAKHTREAEVEQMRVKGLFDRMKYTGQGQSLLHVALESQIAMLQVGIDQGKASLLHLAEAHSRLSEYSEDLQFDLSSQMGAVDKRVGGIWTGGV